MTKRAPPAGARRGRHRRMAGSTQGRHRDDPYEARLKPAEPASCRECGAVFHDGRWRWGAAPPGAAGTLCPACQRIHDDYPAGIVTLRGRVVRERRAEVESLIRHQEEVEKAQHPLNRIMAIEAEAPDALTVTTTDIHLPRRVGEAVERAFHGTLALDYDEDGYFLRVDWSGPE